MKLGTYPIWLTGSRRTIHRVVLQTGGKCFVKFGKQYIEVKHGSCSYYTVESY